MQHAHGIVHNLHKITPESCPLGRFKLAIQERDKPLQHYKHNFRIRIKDTTSTNQFGTDHAQQTMLGNKHRGGGGIMRSTNKRKAQSTALSEIRCQFIASSSSHQAPSVQHRHKKSCDPFMISDSSTTSVFSTCWSINRNQALNVQEKWEIINGA